MDATAFIDILRAAVPDVPVEWVPSPDQPTISVPAPSLTQVALALRDGPALRFTFLADLTAVDWWPREPRFEVVYHLVSLEHRVRLRLKVRLPGDRPELRTVQAVWPAANWLEREVWDLLGIVFSEHGDLRRLLMPDDWQGHPLRKDYPVQIRLAPKTWEPLQVSEAEFRANVETDRDAREGSKPGE
jgi:NADH-quinone oxidoreductase subunit C